MYAVSVPAERENLLWGKLESINGIAIDEILERLADYASGETEYWRTYLCCSVYMNALLVRASALKAAGVMGPEASGAVFGFTLEDGTAVEEEIPSVAQEDLGEVMRTRINKSLSAVGSFMYSNRDKYIWYEQLREDNILYLRISSCNEQADLNYAELWERIAADAQGAYEAQKIVIDLRGNTGGTYEMPGFKEFISSLDNADIEGLYVLADNGTFSRAVIVVSEILQASEKAVLVGTPLGGVPNAFAPSVQYDVLPNSMNAFVVSERYIVSWPDFEEDALVPDIEIRPTIADYKQGIDTILEAVK